MKLEIIFVNLFYALLSLILFTLMIPSNSVGSALFALFLFNLIVGFIVFFIRALIPNNYNRRKAYCSQITDDEVWWLYVSAPMSVIFLIISFGVFKFFDYEKAAIIPFIILASIIIISDESVSSIETRGIKILFTIFIHVLLFSGFYMICQSVV